MFCPVQKAMDLLSLRLLFILMASSFGLARLLRGSGSQYFNSSVATFKEMAVLLLTQDRATSIPKLLPHGYPCSWSTFSIILVKAKGVEVTDANSCCVASCQESPENRLLVASFFFGLSVLLRTTTKSPGLEVYAQHSKSNLLLNCFRWVLESPCHSIADFFRSVSSIFTPLRG